MNKDRTHTTQLTKWIWDALLLLPNFWAILWSACHTITPLSSSPLGTMKSPSVQHTLMEMTPALYFLKSVYFGWKHEHCSCSKWIFNNMFILFLDFQQKWKYSVKMFFLCELIYSRLHLWTPGVPREKFKKITLE